MRFEYILLICIFLLPCIYKLWYWQDVFRSQNNDIKNFGSFVKSREGSESLLHFWVFLEIPLLCMSILPFFNPPFEIFLFSIMFYFGLLYNVFVIGKILRKKIQFPKINIILILTVIFLIFDGVLALSIDERFLYIFLVSLLLFMPLYFIIAIFLSKFLNKKTTEIL